MCDPGTFQRSFRLQFGPIPKRGRERDLAKHLRECLLDIARLLPWAWEERPLGSPLLHERERWRARRIERADRERAALRTVTAVAAVASAIDDVPTSPIRKRHPPKSSR